MAEWTIAPVLKTVGPSRVPGVRIPLLPPLNNRSKFANRIAFLVADSADSGVNLAVSFWRVIYMPSHSMNRVKGRSLLSPTSGQSAIIKR